MSTMPTESVTRRDPRRAYPRPPFQQQQQIGLPGKLKEMEPKPDHGEKTYRGSGKLKGMNAIITGGDSGIGRATAIAYAREGANVAIVYLSEDQDANETAKLIEEAGTKALLLKGDITNETTCEELIDQAVKNFGSLDILVNNAAHQEVRESLEEMSTELFDRIFKTNVYATFWLSRAALPRMNEGGSIINTVSIQGYQPSPNLLPYAATKSALIGFTKGLAKLAIQRGVRVNAVAPGPVWTPLIPGSMPEDSVESFGGSSLFERPAQPAELAPLFVWLASPEASYVTAEVYSATGGNSPV